MLKKRVRSAKTWWRDRLRAQIVLAAARGRDNARIAADLGITADTARKWRGRFAARGMAGLEDLPRSGRPRRISEADRAAVVALACQLPAATGVPLARWTGPELAAELTAQGLASAPMSRYLDWHSCCSRSYRHTCRGPVGRGQESDARNGFDEVLAAGPTPRSKQRPEALWRCGGRVAVEGSSPVLQTAADELLAGLGDLLGITGVRVPAATQDPQILIAEPGSPAGEALLSTVGKKKPTGETVIVKKEEDGFERIVITSDRVEGCLHGVFSLLRHLQVVGGNSCPEIVERTANSLRIAAHWDNIDGSVERGYSGHSIFFREGTVTGDLKRVRRYARLLASVGINGVVVNNVNVTGEAARLTMDTGLEGLQRLADIFREYGISLFLSASFASPVVVGGRQAADPRDPEVARWWREVAQRLYAWVPDLGGLVVKVDSEGQPGPGSYGRDQADGANVIARALAPHGGVVLWRAFVYDCGQDWRDRKTDRARAAFDTFAPLDGKFESNVVLQIKLGPIDFQVREPPSPLLTALEETRIAVEVQVTQEYTGQQIDLCFLPPQWTDVMATRFRRGTEAVTIADLVSGYTAERSSGGVVGVANVGAGASWTGHPLAQANLYGLGRFAWDPLLPPAVIAEEWATQTFGPREPVVRPVVDLLLSSWRVYEAYSAPLGVGFMVNPGLHYGPNVDGYEYSRWGTYHHADRAGSGEIARGGLARVSLGNTRNRFVTSTRIQSHAQRISSCSSTTFPTHTCFPVEQHLYNTSMTPTSKAQRRRSGCENSGRP
jgi:alpha-glucuronidase